MANINQLIANAVRGDLFPSGDTPSVNDGNPYNNPNYVEPPSDPNDLGEVYNGPAAPDTGWTPPVITKSNNLANNTQSKQSTVAATAAAKQQALMTPAEFYNNSIAMETGQGRATASQMEQDLRDLTPAGIYQKYGVDVGSQLISGQAEGNRQSLIDQTRGTRTATEMWDDFNVEFGQGLGNALGGVAGLAAAPISEDAGTGIASLMGDFNKFMDSSKSDRLTARKNLMEGKQALDMRDNAAQQQKDIEESGKAVAGLKRFGRDLVDTLGNATSDSATLGAGISNALGSLVAAGPVAKGLSAVSKGRLGITASIAATEAGGAYNQITDDVLNRSFEQLAKEHPMFNELLAADYTPEEARITVANRTGMLAGVITAPAAALAGRLVHKFEANPLGFGSGGIKQALGSIGRETIEESTQSLTGQFAQNFAEQQIANTNKDLSEGVGRATAEGGLYGMGMSAVLAGPGIARSAAGKAVSAIAERAAGVDEANKKASPVADETVAAADAEVQAAAPVAESVLREAAGTDAPTNAYVDTLMSATKFEPTEAPAQFQEAVGDVTSRVGAIQRMAEVVNSAPEGSPEQLRAGHYLNSLVQDFTEVINTDPAALSALPADNPASQIVAQYQGLMGAVQNSPKVMAALEAVWAAAENAEPVKATVDAQTLATPEGQQDVADVIGNAEIAPEKGDLGTTEQVLYQIEQGNLNVTPRQKAALDTSVALLRAVQAADIEAQRTGTTDPVSLNISSVDGEKGKSVTQHAKGIMSAWKSGDRELAADRLTDLATFAEGMANKVDALNTHFAAGDPKADGLRYGITVNGVPQMSKTKMAARVNTQGGVEFAQKVAREAKMLADVYNGLVEAFPDLGGEHLNVAPLAAELNGPVAEVVARNTKPAVVAAENNPAAPATKTESQPAASVEDSIESAAASLQQKVEDAFASENAEFLALDSNTSITEAQRDRLSELDSLLYTISGVEEIAQGVSVSKAAMETLSTVLPTNLFEELKTTRTQAIQQRNAAKPQPAAPVAKPAPTQKVEAKPATVKAESAIADRNGYVQSIADKVVNLPDGSKLYEPDTDTTVTIQHTVSPNTGVKQTDVIGDNGKVRFSLVQNKDGTWKELGDAYLDSAIEPVVAEETVVEPTVEKTPVLEGIAAAFPTVPATFHKAFKLPSKQRTRTIGDEAPVNTIRSALKDSASLTAFIGSSIKGDYTKEIATAYAGYLGMAENFHGELDDRLQAFLDQPYSKGNPTTMGQILSGEKEVLTGKGVVFDPLRTPQGKALGITETINGEIVYNPELSQMAVLAGMQWFLSSDQYGTLMDAKDLAESFGLNEGALDDTVVDLLNQGMGLEEAVRTLGSKIRGYWGVTPDSNGSRGYTEGIPEGVAKEVISVMLDAGWLTQETVTLTEKDGLPAGEVRTPVRIIPTHKIRDENNKLPNDPLADVREFPAAIEQAVLLEPEDIKFIGEDSIPPVAQEQMRNPGVANTAQQQEMMANEQATPYYPEIYMAGLTMAIGSDAFVDLFGAGDLENKVLNKNHAQSLDGVNRSIVAEHVSLKNLLAEMANHGELGTVPIRHAVNMVRVNRMQMLGKFNPQASKTTRTVISPTRSTLDLTRTTDRDYGRYITGLAQLLGEKVHNQLPEVSRTNAEAVLNGPLAPAVAALQNWLKGFTVEQVNNPSPMSSSVLSTLKAAFADAEMGLTREALQAITNYARYKNAGDLTAFNTSVALEADGKTNGPIMAMNLFTVGGFTAGWLRNIAKGGVYFNRPGESSNTYSTYSDKNDLYQATTDELKNNLQAIRDNYASNAKVTGQLDSLFYLMDEFLGGDLQFSRAADGTPQLALGRVIAKNPLTITIYGSGAGGIASKMTKAVMDSIYERMSQVAQARADGATSMAEAMFGPQSSSLEEAQQKLLRFTKAFNELSTKQTAVGTNGLYVKTTDVATIKDIDPVEFTLSAAQSSNIQANMLNLFVAPMRSAITNTVGGELMATAETLRQATQAQSIVLEYAFKDAVEQALADKAKDPNWHPGDFLTIKEEADLRKKLEHLSPLVQTGTQNFYIAGSEKSDIKMTEFSRSLDGKLNTPANIAGPRDAGVSGIPFMNIGAGDGQTMQNMSVDPNGPTGTLKVFDGVYMPLDQIEDGSVSANKAALDAMLGNPLAAVYKSYSNFMSDAKLTDMSDAQRKALSKALFGLGSETMSEAEIVNAMTNLVGKLNVAQQSIEARHRVMRKSPLSIDQMAAANSPYQQQGTLAIVGTDFDAVAEQLTAHYYVELEQVQGEATVRKMDEAFYDNGTLDDSGVVTMSGKDLLNAIDTLPENQKAVLTEVGNSLAAQDYTILLGTAEQVAEYNNSRGLTGLSSLPTGDVKGYTNVGLKQVVLLNPSSETFAHELLHAATYEAIDAHYGGETNDAVPRIEAMMEQFINQATELSHTSDQLNTAYNSALAAINGHLADGNKAAALNEYMAWTLANESLSRVAERTDVTKLARVKGKLIAALKSLLGIKADVGNDVFSNLLFNSAILMHAQVKLNKRFNQSILFQNSIYGQNDRLTRVNEALDKTIGRYLQEAPQSGRFDQQSALAQGIRNGMRVAESFMSSGFNMNMQEASTFRTIVASLATEAAIDPNAMAGVQQLYSHVMKNLKVESFMTDPTDDAARYYAGQKYDVLSGKMLVTQDIKGRSSLLPAFLALATVSEEFRAVLANMDLPKSAHNTAGTLDALLENTGNKFMDKLSARMAGQKKASNVVQALDQLNNHMADVINARETFIDQVASKGQGVLDRTNEIMVTGMNQLAGALLKNSKRAAKNASNKLDRTVSGIGAGVAALIDNTAAAGVAQATMTNVNRSNIWPGFRDLIGDLVGRTPSNANIYDMIKAVRSVAQRTRQQYRIRLPKILAAKFTRELTVEEKHSLHKSMGKSDLAALGDNALELATDSAKRAAGITKLEAGLSKKHIAKGKQLANYMVDAVNGFAGQNLLRNAESVAQLFDENYTGPIPDVNQVDQLITLYAIDALPQQDRDTLASLAQNEAVGLNFALDYMRGQRAEEQGKSTGMAKMNAFKGHIPNMLNEGMSMVIADDSKYSELVKQSYVRIGDYSGSPLERGLSRGYYFIPVAARGSYEQGILQNVVQTAGGVNAATGLQIGQTAGAITDQADVKQLVKRMSRDGGREALMPVRDENGNITAFERALDPEVMARLYTGNDLLKTIGVWRGRQVEEGFATEFNSQLIGHLKDMLDKDNDPSQYVDVFNTKDPVLKDAAKLFSQETRAMIESQFGDKFMVRKDMLNDALGYRMASVGDIWTGNSRWSPETQKNVRNLAVSMMGNNAYKMLMNFEKGVQQVVSDAKVLIVVKSVIVPAVNMISNTYQLVSRGVPLNSIAKGMPKKLAEVEAYTKSLVRKIEAEAELRAAHGDIRLERKLKTEIQAINDDHRRMSIWPLIEAGEFSGISDAGLTRGDIELTSGRMQAYMESLVNKLPERAKNVGRYALVTKDTALYQGLQKAVEYGDFLGKAILYDDLTQRKGLTQAQALARITEEFVNYDRLTGRFRSSMEAFGLMWFYNFKIRIAKIALSTIRNNPVHALLATLAPQPTLFGTVGLPTDDNMFTKLVDGSLWRSLGPAQGFHAASLNPWYNLTQ